MSKYIKLEDAISKIVNTPTRVITDDLTALVDRQHEIIDMLADLPTIEPDEDYVSREYALEVIDDCINYPTNGDKACAIKNAQSVVPSRQKGVIGQGSGDINWQAATSTRQEIYAKGYEDGRKSVEVSEEEETPTCSGCDRYEDHHTSLACANCPVITKTWGGSRG